MDDALLDFYKLPHISDYEDIRLLDLSEQCAALEDRVRTIAASLPEQDRQIIEGYLLTRNDLELETFKTALRWGKQHYK